MVRRFSINFALGSMGIDAVAVFLALYLATSIRPFLYALPFAADYPFYIPTPLIVYIISVVVWISIMVLFSVYDGRKNFTFVDELTNLVKATLLAAMTLAGILFLSYREVSRLLFFVFVILVFSMMLSWRMLARLILFNTKSKSPNKRKMIVIGMNDFGLEISKQIQNNPQYGIRVVGYLDEPKSNNTIDEKILGSINDARKVIEEFQVTDVVISLPSRETAELDKLVSELHTLPVKVWIIMDYFHFAIHKAEIEEFSGIPMLDLRAPALNDYQRMIKRAFDLLISIILLPPTLLLMGIISTAIRLEGPGSIFFRQKRVGENGRIFEMIKFRTMIPGADNMVDLVEHFDEEGHLIHKTEEDPRVTTIGGYLRRTSLDELPQLFNVIKGEMSLVGPRPELPYLVDKYQLWQRKRFTIPPGMTGWWQISGRSDKPMHLNTEYDLFYIQNYSLILDIYILLRTIPIVLTGSGAY
jgi:exopolysaccharide biosynthesis polyprenyl glycosylphosphotransferase